jgi:tetratricopeptide (TPR) repeat protein
LKYTEALGACEEILEEARGSGGKLLEETYVQLWRIYFAMDELDLALGMSQRLLAEFPSSAFIDEAMLQQAHVERKRENHLRAIGLYTSITKLPNSPLRGEGQFHIGECYEAMALKATKGQSAQLFENAFLAYQKVYEQFPDSGRVGDAVAKMAAFYYQKEDYARAVDVFENVLSDHPDANFLDVILFNYGRCLYKLDRKPEARRRFEQLIADFPESEIATEANKIVEALKKAGF